MSTVKSNDIVLLQNIKKDYGQGKVVTEALRGVDLKLAKGDFTAMMGPSGSGTVSYTHLTLPTNREV